ncbi:unnamed protein product [Rotaria sp. Silwood2]|nr:unnamed protein product [Rotaria sp. Silwood2]CAF2743389.1 unnamed protein product [Rotaria sp. Silwood2]CAF3168259.1 unnamed protein product [Rotaria sp. Silwood2]CAF4059073.1 unnamed protein product [Rotaria sp. Silwood2]CAF4127512.1 unnamed protein product [Rotaria sp. Silwood2]
MNDSSSKYQCIQAIRHNSIINNDESVEIYLSIEKKFIGKGTFAIVYKSFIENTKELVAIKEIIVDHKHKNRELEILRKLNHPNIIKLKYYFFKQEINNQKLNNNILCLIMELFPETVYSLIQRWHKKFNQSFIDFNQIKLFTFQIFRALAYLHDRGIAHRDIKPTNILVNCQKGLLKICDFGTAKYLLPNDISVSYICSRYYRAPELILGSTSYTTSIDIWATACVLTEFYSGVPLFKGTDQNDQLFQIILLLGEPNVDEIRDLKPKSDIIIHQQIQRKISLIDKSKTIIEHLTSITKSDFDCVQFCLRLFQYSPNQRLTALYALKDKYYDEIRQKKSLIYLLEFDQTELHLFDSSVFKSIINENKSPEQQSTEKN